MPNPNVRVVIPDNKEELLQLILRIARKHTADGANSKLRVMDNVQWDTLSEKAAEAQGKHDEAEALNRLMEQKYKERDALCVTMDDDARATRDFLLGLHRNEPFKLGEYGYDVNAAGSGDDDGDNDDPQP